MVFDSKSSGLVLCEKPFLGAGTPPTAFYDCSRFSNNGSHSAITYVKLPSGLHVRSFNGSTSIVDCGSGVSLGLSLFTLAVWVNTTISTTRQAVICRGGTPRNYLLDISGSSASKLLTLSYQNSGGTWLSATGTNLPLIQSNIWYHVAVTFNLTNIVFYLNAQTDSYSLPGASAYSSTPLYLGSGSPTWLPLNGYLSLPKIYNRDISAAQILAIYESERRWFGV